MAGCFPLEGTLAARLITGRLFRSGSAKKRDCGLLDSVRRRQLADTIAPIGQRALRLIWPLRSAVEQYAAGNWASDGFARQYKYILALDFMPASALHRCHAGCRLCT
jgi:hypothetical protein